MSLHAMTWAFEQNLPCAQKFVLVALGDAASPSGECFPSQKTIAERCGLSRVRVNQILGELEELGFIHISSRTRKNGADSSNLYILACPEEILPGREERPADVRGCVYVMAHGTRCKIGFTRQIERRHKALCAAAGQALEVVGTVECGMSMARKLERAAHEHFQDSREQGEWFDLQGDVAIAWLRTTYAKVVSTGFTPPVSTDDTPPVKQGDTGVLSGETPVSTEPLRNNPNANQARAIALTRWPEVWRAFAAWPHLPDTATQGRARATWERLLDELPPVDDLIGRINAQAAKLRVGGARGRGGWATAPHNWLERDRGWADFAPAAKADDGAVRALLGGAAGKLVDAMGPGSAPIVGAWFRDAQFEAGPPVKIMFPKAWRRDQVARRYGGALKRAFGDDFILEAAA